MKCYIDNREQERSKRALSYYLNKGYPTSIFQLTYGDYAFYKNGIAVAFEYKTIADFIASIEDNRVFNQALNQSNNYSYHFVIIVGSESDYKKAIKERGRNTGHYISNYEINGSIASLVNFTSVLQVKNESLAFDLMERIGLKCTNDKPVVKRYPKSRGSPAFRLLNNNVNRVGAKTAQKICDELRLDSIEDVFKITEADLIKIEGIGEKKAKNILSQLKGEFN